MDLLKTFLVRLSASVHALDFEMSARGGLLTVAGSGSQFDGLKHLRIPELADEPGDDQVITGHAGDDHRQHFFLHRGLTIASVRGL